MADHQTQNTKHEILKPKSIVLEVQNIRHVLSLNIKQQAPNIAPDKETEKNG